jgi:hypothetical protein
MRNLTFPHSIIDAKIAVNECPCYADIVSSSSTLLDSLLWGFIASLPLVAGFFAAIEFQ